MSLPATSPDTFAKFKYLKWQDIYRTTRPYSNALALSTLDKQLPTNLVFERGHTQKVTDVRGTESSFSLDQNGFIYRMHQTHLTPEDFINAEKVENLYLPECEGILRNEVEQADDILIFDWRVSHTYGLFQDFSNPPIR